MASRIFLLTAMRLLAAGVLLGATAAWPAGMYPLDRGVRPMGRGGAFVAGADDVGSLWYNPAGLAEAPSSVLVDFGWLDATGRHTPRLQVRDADGTLRDVQSPSLQGRTSFLPFPTIGASKRLDARGEWTVAGAVYTPYGAFLDYPDTVDGVPSPGRYVQGSLDGSYAAMGGLWVAWKPASLPWLRAGLGAQLLTGSVQTDVTFSASLPDRVLAAPEDPDFDGQARLKIGPLFAPSANLGVLLIPHRALRFGLSAQLPMVISSPATVQVRMPSSPLFDNAKLEGERLRFRMTLPGVVRAGVELRPGDALRVELAYVRELWSAHETVELRSDDLRLTGVVGLPPSVRIPDLERARNFQDSNAFRLGTEWRVIIGGLPVDLRAGAAYETSGVPPAYVSVQSLDLSKWTTSLGLGLHLGARWRLDAVYARVFADTLEVSPGEARLPRIHPLEGNAPLEAVNSGQYDLDAQLFGLGVQYLF